MSILMQIILLVCAAFLVHLGSAVASESKNSIAIQNRLKELDQLLLETEERDQILKNVRHYAKTMRVTNLGAKEMEQVYEIQNATKKRQKETNSHLKAFLAKQEELKATRGAKAAK
jgi:hypothetical protein